MSRPLRPALQSVIGSLCVLCVGLLAGCTGKYSSNFSLIVVNRTANPLQALVNGSDVGQVAAGQSGTFSLNLQQTNPNVFTNGVAPTPEAKVILAAKDLKTGVLSEDRTTTLSSGAPTYVSFTADDFPSTGPTVARFTFSPTAATINQDVSFNGTSSSVNKGTYDWDFGDGQTGSGATLTHRYARAGTFTVTLVVTSETKAISSASRTISIAGAVTAPNFNFTPASPAINQEVIFTVQQQAGPAAAIGTYAWNFGDRTTGAGTPVSHVFTTGGNYTVQMTFTNDAGLSASLSRQVVVSATLPAGSAAFTFSPTNPRVNDDVFFNASASTVPNATYSWDFGDGTSGTGVTTIHRYSIKRAFTVVLTVRNQLGQIAVTDHVVTLSDP